MASAAECFQVRGIIRSAAASKRANVIALEPSGAPARAATPSVALEHLPAHPRPSPPVETGVKPGAAPGHQTAP